jgi:hypothetical protein
MKLSKLSYVVGISFIVLGVLHAVALIWGVFDSSTVWKSLGSVVVLFCASLIVVALHIWFNASRGPAAAAPPSLLPPAAPPNAIGTPTPGANQVVYIVDQDLIRFAKFAIAVLAIFVTVGLFLWGFDIKQAAKEVHDSADQVHKTNDDIKSAREEMTTNVKKSLADLEEAKGIANANRKQIEDLEQKTKGLLDSASQDSEQISIKLAQLNKQFRSKLADQNQLIEDLSRQVNRRRPVPVPTGNPPFRLSLDRVVGAANIQAIQKAGKLVFHVAGNTGGGTRPGAQLAVADAMTRQCQTGDHADRPAFLYLLGNVVYYNGEAKEYYKQFYQPYLRYPLPIFAIPGNHDAANLPDDSQPSLAAFVENFCSATKRKLPQAGDASRLAMTQPNVYWTLEMPYATAIGLYTNVPVGGYVDDQQKAWLIKELKEAPPNKAIILAMHYSPYTETMSAADQPSGMAQLLRETEDAAQRHPDLILSAHAQLYSRYMRQQVPYVVAGTGGYWSLRKLREPLEAPAADVSIAAKDGDHHGFLRITATSDKIVGEYFTVETEPSRNGAAPVVLDKFEVRLR